MVAPAGVPPGIANRLSQEIRKVMETPEVRAHFLTQGATPRTMTSAEMGRYIADEYSRWGTIIQQSGIKAGSQ